MIAAAGKGIAASARWVLARLATDRERVSRLEKLLRGALLVPVFGAMWTLLRLGSWLGGPMPVAAATRAGDRYLCALPDFIQTYLYLFGVWEPDVTAFMLRRLSPGATFVDVGANVGYHALVAARALGGEGRVVAIEASPSIFALLEGNLAANGATARVRAVNKAAGETAGTVRTFKGPDRNIGLSSTVESRGLSPEADVDAAPLADLLEPDEISTARLVKIDVEGAEDQVLRGMGAFLDRCPRDVEIVLELSPTWWKDRDQTPRQVLQPLLDAGFNVYEIDNNLWPWRYLWARDVRPPRRLRASLDRRVPRLDLVLSRADAEEL